MKLSIAASALLGLLASAAPVFKPTDYNTIQISGGNAGNAKQEALDALAGLPADLSTVEQADIDFLNSVNQVANDAEDQVFNPAIAAASGDAADALQRGKIKNKVLKLTATILKLQTQAAQGKDVADQLATEQTKLDNNISQDVDEAGNPSTALSFDADIPE